MAKTKKNVAKNGKISRVWSLIRSHKLIVFLSVLVLLFPASYGYEKYLDWDNAQMIKGLARDFPELVAQIEAETGLDLEEKTDCMTTSEKFSTGVKTCEFLFYADGETEEQIKEVYSVIQRNSKFTKGVIYENKEGYRYNYRNKQSCSFRNVERVYGSCILGVRDANKNLVTLTLSK